MSDETLRILKLLEVGKITSQEAEGLLAAIKEPASAPVGENDEFLYHGANPARIVARVLDEVNPASIAAEAMERARERMERHRERHLVIRVPKIPKIPKMPRMPEMPDCCFGSHSAEDEQVVTVPADGLMALSLSQPRSEIKASGADTGQVVIRAAIKVFGDDKDEASERLKSLKVTAENENGTLRVKLDGPPWTKKRRAQVDFELEVPRNLSLELGTASGEIEVSNTAGGGRLNSASGEISLEGCSGSFEISTASGDIGLSECQGISARIQTASGDMESKDCRGDFSVQSVSGDVSFESSGGRVSVSTVSGDLELEAEAIESLSAATTSGDISVDLDSSPGGEVRLASVSGDVELEMPDDSDIALEAATASGDIECGLELAEASRTSRRLTGRLGSGRVPVTIKTTSGDISIE